MTTSPDTAITQWYRDVARPFLEKVAPDRVAEFNSDCERLPALAARQQEEVAVCFLGDVAIGKSTLISALVAGAEHILPQGGIGPLTAQATSVRYSERPDFRASYHPPKTLWRMVFVLETSLARSRRSPTGIDYERELDPSERDQLAAELDLAARESTRSDLEKDLLRQARLLVTGDQEKNADVGYLIDSLRSVLGYERRWGTTPDPMDDGRLLRLRAIVDAARDGRAHAGPAPRDERELREEIKTHAAGFLAPVIAKLDVGWPSKLLEKGLVLVDLPGVGIANDVYRQVTREWVQSARVIVLVVGRGGVTEACADLLRASTFMNRLLFAADDPDADPVGLVVAVTRMDDIAETRASEDKTKKKRQHLENVFDEMRPKIKEQLRTQLESQVVSSDQLTGDAQKKVAERLVERLIVRPLSALQYRKLIVNDEDDRPFVSSLEESGVPDLERSLIGLVDAWRSDLRSRLERAVQNLHDRIGGILRVLEAQWTEGHSALEEANRIRAALEVFVKPLRSDFDNRTGAFRDFLRRAVPLRIEDLVREATAAAERDIVRHLSAFRKAPAQTLMAAVRKGGTFHGARRIDLVSDFLDRCEGPIAAIWGEKILRDVRDQTKALVQDYVRLGKKVEAWATTQDARKNAAAAGRAALEAEAKNLEVFANALVDELRDKVRSHLESTIEPAIRSSCEKFVEAGKNTGTGVRDRIVELFEETAQVATMAVRAPAISFLKKSFSDLAAQVKSQLERVGDPLEKMSLAIVGSEAPAPSADEPRRLLEELRLVIASQPSLGGTARHCPGVVA